MKLLNNELGIDIYVDNLQPKILTIENTDLFTRAVEGLYRQSNGESGTFILSENDSIFDFGKEVEVVINPFALDFNNRKFIKKIYSDLNEMTLNEKMLMFRDAMSAIQAFINDLSDSYPIALTSNIDISLNDLLKLFNVRIDQQDYKLAEKLAYYIQLSSRLLRTRLFVFINLYSYLDDENIFKLEETIRYENVALLFIESNTRMGNCNLSAVIIDKDKCVIDTSEPENSLTPGQGDGFGEDLIF